MSKLSDGARLTQEGGLAGRWLRRLGLAAVALTLLVPAMAAAGPEETWIDRWQVNAIKSALATMATALLVWGVWLRARGRAEAHRRLRDGLLLSLGVLSALAWWNLGQFHFPRYVHPSDMYHYYLGAKYFPELGSTRLYACTAVADLDAGRAYAEKGRRIRNLETNVLEPVGPVLDDPSRCTRHFSPERWSAFRADAALFRAYMAPSAWRKLRTDHGYNGTPAWGVLGSLLAHTGPASLNQLLALALLDPLLLGVMWGTAFWAFGWRATCVALVFWGTNYPAAFGWVGGGYLRQDWLVATVVGIGLLRRERSAAGGFLLMTAALLRIFPGWVLAGLGLQALVRMIRARGFTLSTSHRRIAAGAALAAAVWLPLSAATSGGFGAWAAFAENSRVHLSTPLVNHMGLPVVFAYDGTTRSQDTFSAAAADPFTEWKQARRDTFHSRRWAFAACVAAFALLLARAVERQGDWVAAVLSLGILPVAFELTGYYYAVLLAYGFLTIQRERIGAALCALSALSWLFVEVWHWTDVILTWTSLAAVGFVTYAAIEVLWGERAPPSTSA
ncbi:MAG: hypothetical protein ACR2P8_03365 [Myxococcota bacterium]